MFLKTIPCRVVDPLCNNVSLSLLHLLSLFLSFSLSLPLSFSLSLYLSISLLKLEGATEKKIKKIGILFFKFKLNYVCLCGIIRTDFVRGTKTYFELETRIYYFTSCGLIIYTFHWCTYITLYTLIFYVPYEFMHLRLLT